MKLLKILIITTLLLNKVFSQQLNYISVNIGAGGSWLFMSQKLTYYDKSGVCVFETFNINTEIGIYKKFGIGLDFYKSGLFGVDATFTSLSTRYFPFSWYNRLYIGLGGAYFNNMNYEQDVFEDNTFKICFNYGLQIQFPKNIYLIADFKHFFGSKETINYKTYHFLVLTGTLGYRFNFTNKETTVNQ